MLFLKGTIFFFYFFFFTVKPLTLVVSVEFISRQYVRLICMSWMGYVSLVSAFQEESVVSWVSMWTGIYMSTCRLNGEKWFPTPIYSWAGK